MSQAAFLLMVFLSSVFQDRVVRPEVENVKKLGVKIETDVIIGKSVTIDELMEEEGFELNYFPVSGYGIPNYYEEIFLTNNKLLEGRAGGCSWLPACIQKGL